MYSVHFTYVHCTTYNVRRAVYIEQPGASYTVCSALLYNIHCLTYIIVRLTMYSRTVRCNIPQAYTLKEISRLNEVHVTIWYILHYTVCIISFTVRETYSKFTACKTYSKFNVS